MQRLSTLNMRYLSAGWIEAGRHYRRNKMAPSQVLWEAAGIAKQAPTAKQPPALLVGQGRWLFRGALHLVVGIDEILLVERLVAVEAGGEIGGGVGRLVRLEGLVFPFAVADVVRILGAPAGPLLHHGIGDEIALH